MKYICYSLILIFCVFNSLSIFSSSALIKKLNNVKDQKEQHINQRIKYGLNFQNEKTKSEKSSISKTTAPKIRSVKTSIEKEEEKNPTNNKSVKNNNANQTPSKITKKVSKKIKAKQSEIKTNKKRKGFILDQSVVLGPIIGRVTSTSARILVEFKYSSTITMELTEEVTANVYTKVNQVQAYTPIIFLFNNLTPFLKYTVKIIYSDTSLKTISGLTSSFKTLKGNLVKQDDYNRFNVIFVSCNDVRYAEKLPANAQLWNDLSSKAQKGEIDYIFHIGDQVYLDHDKWLNNPDNAYSKIQLLLKAVKQVDYGNHTEEVRNIIREEYRRSMTFKPTAEVLSLVPNLMILDDHDIMDSFGYLPSIQDPISLDYFYANQARYVYYQYQRQLREDIDFTNYQNAKDEFFIDIKNDIGFFVLDYRGSKTWHKSSSDNKSTVQLGSVQTQAYKKAFSPNGVFNNAKAVVLVSTIPMFLFSNTTAKTLGLVIPDMKEHWTYNYEDELLDLLDTIQLWKDSDSERQVLFVGGDVHMGGYSEIYYKNQPFGRQLVTSGINQIKIEKYKSLAEKALIKLNDSLKRDYTYIHHNFIAQKNYGTVSFSALPFSSNKVDINMFLTTTDDRSNPIKRKTFSNDLFTHSSSRLITGISSILVSLLIICFF